MPRCSVPGLLLSIVGLRSNDRGGTKTSGAPPRAVTPLPRRPCRVCSIAGPPVGCRARSPDAQATVPLAGPTLRGSPALPAQGTSPDAAAEDRRLRLSPTTCRDHTAVPSPVSGIGPRHPASPPPPAICLPTGRRSRISAISTPSPEQMASAASSVQPPANTDRRRTPSVPARTGGHNSSPSWLAKSGAGAASFWRRP